MKNPSTWIAHESHDEMVKSTTQRAALQGAISTPFVAIKEGDRQMLVTSLPIRDLITYAVLDPAPIGGSLEDVQRAYNRPLDEEHAKSFAEYLVANPRDPFIPAFCLNAVEPLELHWTPKINGNPVAFPMGIMLLPRTSRLIIVDGQHRIYGFHLAYKLAAKNRDRELERRLDETSVPLLITMEHDIRKSHLDFFDASRTKPLPPSQLAAYDTRNISRALLADLVHDVPLFAGARVDFTSQAIKRKSPTLWLFSHLYSVEKTFITGSYAMNEADFEALVRRNLKVVGSPFYEAARREMREFFIGASQAIPSLEEAVNCTTEDLPQKAQEWRASGNLLFTLPGLAVLARIGYDLANLSEHERRNRIQKLGIVNWKRSAKLWSDVGLVHGDRIVSAHKTIELAAKAIQIQLAPPTKNLRGRDGEPVETLA